MVDFISNLQRLCWLERVILAQNLQASALKAVKQPVFEHFSSLFTQGFVIWIVVSTKI